MKLLLTLALVVAAGIANARDEAGESENQESSRSNISDHFIFSVNGGYVPLAVLPQAFRIDFSARAQINRWVGVLANYHNTWVDPRPRLLSNVGRFLGQSRLWS